MRELYFDWAATAIPEEEILEEVKNISLTCFGNPSSAHSKGKEAFQLLEECRKKTADLLGASGGRLIFTSGGTESDNLVLFSLLGRRRAPGSLVVSAFEHPAVWEPAKYLGENGWNVRTVPAEPSGQISLEKLSLAILPDTEMVSIMAVNNETGSLQPLEEISRLIREKEKLHGHPIFFHTDGVQALGKEKVNLLGWGVDGVSFSGHKIGAPRGSGCLYLKKSLPLLNRGGGQEGGFRSGTENLAGIYGFTRALEKRVQNQESARAGALELRDLIYQKLKSMGGVFCAPEEILLSPAYSPWMLWVSFPPLPGEVTARVLSDRGVLVSTGSACASRHKKTFRVSRGLGIPDKKAFSALRISWGPAVTVQETLEFLEILEQEVQNLMRAFGKAPGRHKDLS